MYHLIEIIFLVHLDPEVWQKFQLVERLPVTGNSSIFRFKLPTPNDSLYLPIGRHLHIRAIVDGMEVIRSYTPISLPDEKGYFELLVKVIRLLIRIQRSIQLVPSANTLGT